MVALLGLLSSNLIAAGPPITLVTNVIKISSLPRTGIVTSNDLVELSQWNGSGYFSYSLPIRQAFLYFNNATNVLNGYVIAQGFTGDGTHLTNVPIPFSSFNYTNLDNQSFVSLQSGLASAGTTYSNWGRFSWLNTQSNIQSGNPICIMRVGDGLAFSHGFLRRSCFQTNSFIFAGYKGWFYGQNDFALTISNHSGNASISQQGQFCYKQFPYFEIGDAAYYGGTNNGKGGGVYADVGAVAYLSCASCSTNVLVQTNIANSSGWTTVTNLNFAQFADNQIHIFSWTNPAGPALTQIRLLNAAVGGAPGAIVIDASLINSKIKTNALYVADWTGTSTATPLQQRCNANEAYLAPLFRFYNPSLIIHERITYNGANDQTNIVAWTDFIHTNTPNADIVYAGIYPVAPDNGITYTNRLYMRSNAVNYGYGYFDGYSPFINLLTMTSRGWVTEPDEVHLTDSGDQAYSQMLVSWLALDQFNFHFPLSSGGGGGSNSYVGPDSSLTIKVTTNGSTYSVGINGTVTNQVNTTLITSSQYQGGSILVGSVAASGSGFAGNGAGISNVALPSYVVTNAMSVPFYVTGIVASNGITAASLLTKVGGIEVDNAGNILIAGSGQFIGNGAGLSNVIASGGNGIATLNGNGTNTTLLNHTSTDNTNNLVQSSLNLTDTAGHTSRMMTFTYDGGLGGTDSFSFLYPANGQAFDIFFDTAHGTGIPSGNYNNSEMQCTFGGNVAIACGYLFGNKGGLQLGAGNTDDANANGGMVVGMYYMAQTTNELGHSTLLTFNTRDILSTEGVSGHAQYPYIVGNYLNTNNADYELLLGPDYGGSPSWNVHTLEKDAGAVHFRWGKGGTNVHLVGPVYIGNPTVISGTGLVISNESWFLNQQNWTLNGNYNNPLFTIDPAAQVFKGGWANNGIGAEFQLGDGLTTAGHLHVRIGGAGNPNYLSEIAVGNANTYFTGSNSLDIAGSVSVYSNLYVSGKQVFIQPTNSENPNALIIGTNVVIGSGSGSDYGMYMSNWGGGIKIFSGTGGVVDSYIASTRVTRISSGGLTVSGSLLPNNNNGIDIGAAGVAWRDAYIGRTVYVTNGIASYNNNTAAPTSISVTASVFNYTNVTGADIQVFLDANGGTTSVSYNGTTIFTSLVSGDHTILMHPNARIGVTYSIATPIMSYVTIP